eukprot:m.290201 g.290201  ORF g.290201 m.290201 type:complete len:222 (+) comp55072_c0_seq8:270-935(+)
MLRMKSAPRWNTALYLRLSGREIAVFSLGLLEMQDGVTPLMNLRAKMWDYNSSLDCLAAVQLLLAHGAYVHLQNKRGQTAKEIAKLRHSTEAADMLQAHEEYLANLGAHTKPAVRAPAADAVTVEPTDETLARVNLLAAEQQTIATYDDVGQPGAETEEGVQAGQQQEDHEASGASTVTVSAEQGVGAVEAAAQVEGAHSYALQIELSFLEAELETLPPSQ